MYIVPCSLAILIDGQLPYRLRQVHALLQHTLQLRYTVPMNLGSAYGFEQSPGSMEM